MSVEREVVGRERDVRVEQGLEAAAEGIVDDAGVAVPEQAVVDEKELAPASAARSKSSRDAETPQAIRSTSRVPATWRPIGP